VFENDVNLDDNVIFDEAHIYTARVLFRREPLDSAQSWAPRRDAHHAITLDGGLSRNRRDGVRRDLHLATALRI
jgi:hypothetical protein